MRSWPRRDRSKHTRTSQRSPTLAIVRILHTSDWHLGRTFGPISLIDDQAAFIDWLVELCVDQRVDLVVIAGDLYDRAIAPTEAVGLFRSAVRRLLATGAKVAAISGNHDGADRVASYGELLDSSGLYIRGGYGHIGEVLTLEGSDGPLDLVLLPFLDPQGAPDDLPVDADSETIGNGSTDADDVVLRRAARTHQSVLRAAIDAVRPTLLSPRSVAVAHAFVSGGAVSESERLLTIGGAGTVEASVFDGFSYTALGHLHRPQIVGGSVSARYSGTPLAYSFSEDHPKEVVLVDLALDGTARVEPIEVPVGRPVCTVSGELSTLLDPTAHRRARRCFVRAIVTDRETVLDAKARLAQVYPHVVEVRLEPVGAPAIDAQAAVATRELSPLEATQLFWEAAEGAPPEPDIDTLLRDAVGAALRRRA